MALINDREYEWADLTLILGGRDLTRFRGLKYSEKIEREAIYAKGRKPISIQSGNLGYEGEIKMLQSEYEALVKAGKGSVLSLSLDALACYGNPLTGDAMLTVMVCSSRFKFQKSPNPDTLKLKTGVEFNTSLKQRKNDK